MPSLRLRRRLTRLLDRAERATGLLRARWYFGPGAARGLCATGPVLVRAAGRLVLGERVTFAGGPVPTELRVSRDGLLEIGDECVFNYGVSIEVARSVRVGRRCMFASFVRVSDVTTREVAPVVIEDDVWLAHGAIVSAGVRVGACSVVAAGAVVTKDVPPGSMAIGNPARMMSLEVLGRERRDGCA